MRDEALFINGVFEEVLSDIARVQAEVPEQVLYLQPYSESRILRLFEWNPSPAHPVRLYVSTSDALDTVSYAASIVSVRDKQLLTEASSSCIGAVIGALQPTEGGIYMHANGHGCRNLIGVLSMARLHEPFPVTEFRMLNTCDHPAGSRTTAGGWWYVQRMASSG